MVSGSAYSAQMFVYYKLLFQLREHLKLGGRWALWMRSLHNLKVVMLNLLAVTF